VPGAQCSAVVRRSHGNFFCLKLVKPRVGKVPKTALFGFFLTLGFRVKLQLSPRPFSPFFPAGFGVFSHGFFFPPAVTSPGPVPHPSSKAGPPPIGAPPRPPSPSPPTALRVLWPLIFEKVSRNEDQIGPFPPVGWQAAPYRLEAVSSLPLPCPKFFLPCWQCFLSSLSDLILGVCPF